VTAQIRTRMLRAKRISAAWELARRFDLPEPEPWMLWDEWVQGVGCDWCREAGPEAPCWGREECHGYLRMCGCSGCAARDLCEGGGL
jgi:hypothetical protein